MPLGSENKYFEFPISKVAGLRHPSSKSKLLNQNSDSNLETIKYETIALYLIHMSYFMSNDPETSFMSVKPAF